MKYTWEADRSPTSSIKTAGDGVADEWVYNMRPFIPDCDRRALCLLVFTHASSGHSNDHDHATPKRPRVPR